MVLELGLRYRPSAQADLEAHSATLALLMADLAEMPPAALKIAIGKWVAKSPYLPKASDLIALAKQSVAPSDNGLIPGETMAQRGNRLMDPRRSPFMRWVDSADGGAHLEWVA